MTPNGELHTGILSGIKGPGHVLLRKENAINLNLLFFLLGFIIIVLRFFGERVVMENGSFVIDDKIFCDCCK